MNKTNEDLWHQVHIDLASMPDCSTFTRIEYIEGELVYTPINEHDVYLEGSGLVVRED